VSPGFVPSALEHLYGQEDTKDSDESGIGSDGRLILKHAPFDGAEAQRAIRQGSKRNKGIAGHNCRKRGAVVTTSMEMILVEE
jgi:hypothetical protein